VTSQIYHPQINVSGMFDALPDDRLHALRRRYLLLMLRREIPMRYGFAMLVGLTRAMREVRHA
jgi:hypothetical protein